MVCFVGKINIKRFTYRNIFRKLFLYLICWLHTTKINLTEEAPNYTRICKKCVICFLLACNIRKQSAASVHINSPKTNANKLPLVKHSVKAITHVFQSITPLESKPHDKTQSHMTQTRTEPKTGTGTRPLKSRIRLFYSVKSSNQASPIHYWQQWSWVESCQTWKRYQNIWCGSCCQYILCRNRHCSMWFWQGSCFLLTY